METHRTAKQRYVLMGLTAFAVFSLKALSSTPSWAAIDYFDLDPEQLLGAEILSASKRMETVAEVPAAVYVITHEDLLRSGVTTIPDALRMVPGVNVAQLNANNWAVSVRGFNSFFANKLLVMIDGRSIYSPVFGGVFWEAHDLVLEDVERIEVVRGPGGTLWGANAVNGVINIITKHTRDTQGNIATALYGAEEQGTMMARHGGRLGEDGFYRVYAKGFNRDSSHNPNGGSAFDDWHGLQSGFRYDQNDRLTMSGEIYQVREHQRRADLAIAAPISTIRNQTLTYEGANMLARWRDQRADGSLLSVQSYIDWATREEPYNFNYTRLIYDLETQYNWAPIGRHEFIGGVGFRFVADNKNGARNLNTYFTPADRYDALYSAFLQDKMTLVPERWFLTLGSKFEHNDYTGFEFQPSARVQYHPSPDQTWWAAVSRAVRTPTPIEHDVLSTLQTAVNVRLATVGNRDFDSEEMIAYELGYRRQMTPNLSVDLTAFENRYNKLATFHFLPLTVLNNGVNPVHFLLPLENRNEMKGVVNGIEMASSWHVRPDVKLSGSYSFLSVGLQADDNVIAQEGAEDTHPYHQLNAKVSWNINENWTLDTSAAYVGDVRANDTNGYVRLDVNLGWQLNDQLRFNLVGQNLVSDRHRELGAPTDLNTGEVERSIFGKLTWEF